MGKNKTNAKKSPRELVRSFTGYVKSYWSKPPAGRYLSLKEAVAYCVGGMGAVGATVVPTFITLAFAVNIAAALNFTNNEIVIVGVITNIVTIARSPLISMIVDNTNTKYGKFRPHLIWMPIPIMLCFVGFGFLYMIPDHMTMLIVYTILFNVVQFFLAIYGLAFNTLIQVITPNQSEKEWLMGIGSLAYSLGPTIVNFIVPLAANLLYSYVGASGKKIMGINTVGPYKWLLPLVLLICFAVGYIVAFGTKERIIKPKDQQQRTSFVKGVKDTSKNKYFWITNVSAVLTVFKLIGISFAGWIYSYAIAEEWAQSVFGTLISTAYTPGMILAPILIKKFGKKNLTIVSNIACSIMTIPLVLACISPGTFTPYLILIIIWLLILMNSIQTVTGPALMTQVYDYQQYKTGERMEGFISQYGAIIGTLFGIATAFVQPAIFSALGFDGNSEILAEDSRLMYNLIGASCLLGVASGIIGTIPYFFWDLDEKRHKEIIEVLKVRAIHGDEKIDDEAARDLEAKIEAGDVDALSNYIIENDIEGLEDYISIKRPTKEESDKDNTSDDDLGASQDECTTATSEQEVVDAVASDIKVTTDENIDDSMTAVDETIDILSEDSSTSCENSDTDEK